jgi:PAS domain S-box-containing protein
MANFKIRLPLQWKIIISVTSVVIVFGIITVYFINKNVGSALADSKRETIELATAQQANEINQILTITRNAADAVPEINGVSAYLADLNKTVQDPAVLRTLMNFGAGRPYLSIYLMDLKGKVVLSTDPSFLNKNLAIRNYFKEATKGGSINEMLIGSITKQPGFYFASSVKGATGKIVGVSVVKMDPQPVYETLIDSYIDKLGKFMLVNEDGVIIFTNKENSIYKSLGKMNEQTQTGITIENRYLGKQILPLAYDQAQQAVEGKNGDPLIYEFYDPIDKEKELINVSPIGGSVPLYLVSEVDYGTVTGVVDQVTNSVIVIIIIVLLLGTTIQVFSLRRVLSPLYKLNKYALAVSSGNFNETVKVSTGDELESLTESVKQMVASLKGFYGGLEEKVQEKTAELEKTLKEMKSKNTDLENTKKAVLNVMEDLSVEKDRLYFEKNRIETILKSIGDGVFVTDNEGKITMTNKAAQEMSGFHLLEAMGKDYHEIFNFRVEGRNEEEYPDFVSKVLKTGKVVFLEQHSVLIGRDGKEIPVLDSAAPVKDIEGNTYGCVVICRNNTRERELEKSKDDFLSVTSHQLRTPLGSMRWNVEMLLAGDAGKLPTEAMEVAQQIHDGNIRMIELVNDLLNVNRIDQGRVLDEPVETDLAQVIRDASGELEVEARERKVKIKLDLDKTTKIVIDPKRLREVIMNLVSNAVKYNRVGGKVEVRLKSVSKQILISVEDNGIGVPKKDMPSVFDKFFRASNAVQSETEGSGLGLYVVKKFVEGWGGKIEMESKEGRGSKFTVCLPLKIAKLKTNE